MTYKNTFQRGIPREEATGVLPLTGGVPMQQGVPVINDKYLEAQEVLTGVPMPGPGLIPEGSLRMVPVAWLLEHIDEVKLTDKQAEDNTSLAAHMDSGQKLPPIHIFINENGFVQLIDGHHRLIVASNLGWTEIEAVVDGKLPKEFKPPRIRCGAETKKGNPCKGWAIHPGLFCMVHDIG
jgi:hypothetical protein